MPYVVPQHLKAKPHPLTFTTYFEEYEQKHGRGKRQDKMQNAYDFLERTFERAVRDGHEEQMRWTINELEILDGLRAAYAIDDILAELERLEALEKGVTE